MDDEARSGAVPCLGDEASTQARTRSVNALYEDAARRLARIAGERGASSRAYRLCRDVWQQRYEDARVSLRHGDVANALVILERGLHVLSLAPTILARNELAFDDVASLLHGV